MSDLLVGVDIGTTHLKVGVFDLKGKPVAFAQQPCSPAHEDGGKSTVRAEQWWSAFEQSLNKCLTTVDRSAIRAIAMSSQAQTYVFLDQQDKVLGPAISWLDTRGDAAGMARELCDYDYQAHGGFASPDPLMVACKLRALPIPNEAAHWLLPEGYLINRLTGRHVVSRNLAAMSGLYSIVEAGWWAEAVAAAGISASLLPTVVDVGDSVATLAKDLADHWGLAEVPVVAGSNDQTAAALGAGLAAPDDTMLALGTALVAYRVVDPSHVESASPSIQGPYVGDLYYHLGVCSTGSAVIDWIATLFGMEANYEELFPQALAGGAGAAGLRFDPFMNDEGNVRQGGAFIGLQLSHTRQHMLRAVLEGLCCAARDQLDGLKCGASAIVTGGGAVDDHWVQLIADVTGRTLTRSSETQATLKGTAMMAAYGAGLSSDLLELARAQKAVGAEFSPRPEFADTYDKVYCDFRRMRRDDRATDDAP